LGLPLLTCKKSELPSHTAEIRATFPPPVPPVCPFGMLQWLRDRCWDRRTLDGRLLQAAELRVYEVRVSEDAKLSAGAFKTGMHDDMATALGLACLFDPSGQQVRYSPAPWV
jgi:hypothetical protein